MIMLFNGDLYSLLNFLSFARWLFIGLVVAGLIYLRYKRPDMPRPFKVTSALYSFTWILPPLLPVARQQGSILWCTKLTSFSGRAELRGNSVCFAAKTESSPARSPALPWPCSILQKNFCFFPVLGGAEAEAAVLRWRLLLSFACLLCSGCVMWAVWKHPEPSAVTQGSGCKYWGYRCQPDFRPVLHLMSPLIKAWIILPPKSHGKHRNLWERAFMSLHIQYQICQFSVQISG